MKKVKFNMSDAISVNDVTFEGNSITISFDTGVACTTDSNSVVELLTDYGTDTIVLFDDDESLGMTYYYGYITQSAPVINGNIISVTLTIPDTDTLIRNIYARLHEINTCMGQVTDNAYSFLNRAESLTTVLINDQIK